MGSRLQGKNESRMKIKNGNKGVREHSGGDGEKTRRRGVARAGQALPLRRTAGASSSAPTNGGSPSLVGINKQRSYESAGSSPYELGRRQRVEWIRSRVVRVRIFTVVLPLGGILGDVKA